MNLVLKIRRKSYFSFGLIFLIIPTSFFLFACNNNFERSNAYIIRVHDGDTFTNQKNINYRLYGVDTAELSSPPAWKLTIGIEHFYAIKARDFVREQILRHKVFAVLMGAKTYNRQVAKIFFKGKDLAILLVQKGLARVAYISLKTTSKYYTSDTDYYYKLKKTEQIAKRKYLGVWKDPSLTTTIFPKM